MVFIVFMTPGMMVLAGVFMLVYARKKPGDVNYMVGYRTERSCASPEAWDFAQKYSAKYALFTGLLTFALTLTAFAAAPHLFTAASAVGVLVSLGALGAQMVVFCLVIPCTEAKLKRLIKD